MAGFLAESEFSFTLHTAPSRLSEGIMGWLEEVKAKGLDVSLACPDGCVDLLDATIIPAGFSQRVHLFAEILSREIEKRTMVKLPVLSRHEFDSRHPEPNSRPVTICLLVDGKLSERLGSEGYKIRVENVQQPFPTAPSTVPCLQVLVSGPTERSILFGIGRFLREAHLDFHQSYAARLQSLCAVSETLLIESTPKYWMRQHQVAYRPKTNSYDAFTVEMMKQVRRRWEHVVGQTIASAQNLTFFCCEEACSVTHAVVQTACAK